MKTIIGIKEGTPVYVFDGATFWEGILGKQHSTLNCYYVTVENPVYGKAKAETKLCIPAHIFEDIEDLREAVLNQKEYLKTRFDELYKKADY